MFGRKKADQEPVVEVVEPLGPGPHDADTIDLEDGVERIDLGGLLISPSQGRELRIQVDEATQQVQSVLIAGQDGALELKPFAAPRNGDLWADIWPQIADDMRRRGGRVEEREGRHGIELVGSVPVDVGKGEMREQPSRVVGVNGPRWLLRATFLGRPAVEPDNAGDWDDVLRQVVVRRGSQAMPVGDALPLRLPPNANRVS
jgi:hypothetical protein